MVASLLLLSCSEPVAVPRVSLDVGPLDGLATGAWLEVQTEPPTGFTLTCVSDGDAWQAERAAAPSVEVRWAGLVAGATYDCVAEAGEGRAFATLALPPLPSGLPVPVVTGDTTGYTLFNAVMPGQPARLLVIDPDGRVRWLHEPEGDPNIGLEASFVEETSRGPMFLVGGGEGYPPRLIDVEGQVQWSAPPAGAGGGAWHHDTTFVPGFVPGTAEQVVGMSRETNTAGGRSFEGFRLDAFLAWSGQRTWTWSSQEAVDRGQLPPATNDPDAYHANAVSWQPDDPEGASYVLSLKRLHQLVRLDPATGDVTWRLGVGGDFALSEADGTPATDDRWFYGQHGPKMIPRGSSGVWDLWVHDNGFDRPEPAVPASRVVHLEVDVPARTARILWEWTEPGWYEPVFGDVDVLDDGHLLVTKGHCPQCGEAAAQVTSYVELDPEAGEVTWRADQPDPDVSGYRADRIAPCALFPENLTHCP
jgi:hypothetical protein